MNNDVIRVGDLVYVVKPMECRHGRLGIIFILPEIKLRRGHCGTCKKMLNNGEPFLQVMMPNSLWAAVDRLKKINPQPINETIETREEQPA